MAADGCEPCFCRRGSVEPWDGQYAYRRMYSPPNDSGAWNRWKLDHKNKRLNGFELDLLRTVYKDYENRMTDNFAYKEFMYTERERAVYLERNDKKEWRRVQDLLDEHLCWVIFRCSVAEFPGEYEHYLEHTVDKGSLNKPAPADTVQRTMSYLMLAHDQGITPEDLSLPNTRYREVKQEDEDMHDPWTPQPAASSWETREVQDVRQSYDAPEEPEEEEVFDRFSHMRDARVRAPRRKDWHDDSSSKSYRRL